MYGGGRETHQNLDVKFCDWANCVLRVPYFCIREQAAVAGRYCLPLRRRGRNDIQRANNNHSNDTTIASPNVVRVR